MTGWGRPAGVSLSGHPHIRTLSVHPRCIHIYTQWICIVFCISINSSFPRSLVFEFPATGGVIPSWNFRTVKLIRYVSASDYFVMACECIFALFIIYYMVEEFLEVGLRLCLYVHACVLMYVIYISVCVISLGPG